MFVAACVRGITYERRGNVGEEAVSGGGEVAQRILWRTTQQGKLYLNLLAHAARAQVDLVAEDDRQHL